MVRRIKHLWLFALVFLSVLLFFALKPAAAEDYGFILSFSTPENGENGQNYRNQDRITQEIFLLSTGQKPKKVKTSTLGQLFYLDTSRVTDLLSKHIKTDKADFKDVSVARRADILTGDDSFLSENLNRGVDVKTAKMAGAAIKFNNFAIGGGYTWDEKNPALIDDDLEEGLVLGTTYQGRKWNMQISYLTSGKDVMGYQLGSNEKKDSLMAGLNYQVNDRVGVSSILRFHQHKRSFATERGISFTVGTRIEFSSGAR